MRIFLPILFVMGLTWAAFWEPAQDRIRVGFIALLTHEGARRVDDRAKWTIPLVAAGILGVSALLLWS